MEPSEPQDSTGVVDSLPEIDPDRLGYLEARVRELEERIPRTRLLDRRFLPRAFAVLGHYIVAGFIVYLVMLALAFSFAAVVSQFEPLSRLLGQDDSSDPDIAATEGPRLSSVASLPVDASGEGTLTGTPTGASDSGNRDGSFELVLNPAPTGLPARTTLDVSLDHSTRVYQGDRLLGDPLDAMNSDNGPYDADPSAAGFVVVRFHIKDGDVFADRLDVTEDLVSD